MTARATALGALMLLLAACGIIAPAQDSAPSQPPVPGNWRLVFHDDFAGKQLDRARWTTCYDWNQDGCTIASNDELEWYLPGQVSVGGGQLTLTAARDPARGSDGRVYPWRSGMISTGRDHWYAEPRRTFTYGYFAASIRIPAGSGMAPQFWMMPQTRFTPPEIDIMEFIGSTRELAMYVHWRDREGAERKQKGTYRATGFPEDHHVFALLWEQEKLVWYVDGVEQFRVTDPNRIPRVPMEVLINLAVGLPDAPPPAVDSARMLVDWVRVWQR